MNKISLIVVVILLSAITGFWISDAMSQVKPATTITKKAKPLPQDVSASTRVTAQSQQLDLETRVAALERHLNELVAENRAFRSEYAGHKHGARHVNSARIFADKALHDAGARERYHGYYLWVYGPNSGIETTEPRER